MPSILNLKFKGNKSFVAFSNLSDTESLTKTWKVCTKVASYLEQGQRLENLSWRLWHLQNLMVDTDNAKSKREFKKLSKCMGDKLDKEKGRAIEELEAPDFRRNHSTELIRQRAAEKEKLRDASHSGTIKRMQFTFSVDQPVSPANPQFVRKPDTKPSAEFAKRTRAQTTQRSSDAVAGNDGNNPMPSNPSLHFPALFSNDFGPSALLYAQPTLTTPMNYGEGLNPSTNNDSFSISRPTIELPLDDILFGDDSPIPSWNSSELPKEADHQDVVMQPPATTPAVSESPLAASTVPLPTPTPPPPPALPLEEDNDIQMEEEMPSPAPSTIKRLSASAIFKNIPSAKESIPETVAPSKVNQLYSNTRSSTPTGRPTLTVRTQSVNTRSSGPGATATSLSAAGLRSGSSSGSGALASGGSSGGNSAPGGVKAECSNCGATHTPLWRRGLNDELNCNACGLYCKLHKRPRPKSMRNSHGEGRAQATVRQESIDTSADTPSAIPTTTTTTHRSSSHSSVSTTTTASAASAAASSQPSNVTAQCYNCHTTATPLWRKDDEGKTVCNACGLYYKLHGSARPISMKSDVIRKRSRHDARRSLGGSNSSSSHHHHHHHTHSSSTSSATLHTTTIHEDASSVSPAASRRASPVRDASPTLAPDSTTQMSYDYPSAEDEATLMGALSSLSSVVGSSSSELMGALGTGGMSVVSGGHGVHGHGVAHGHSHAQATSGTGAGGGGSAGDNSQATNPFGLAFYPGPYHPDYLMQFYGISPDVLPFALETGNANPSTSSASSNAADSGSSSVEDPPSSSSSSVRAMSPRSGSEGRPSPSPSSAAADLDMEDDPSMSPRSSKRRRMSTDSASEPPLSAVSYSSFGSSISGHGGWLGVAGGLGNGHGHGQSHSLSSAHGLSGHHHSHSLSHSGTTGTTGHGGGHHKRASLDFPFATYNPNGTINNGPALRGSENTFWHPPMMPLPVSSSPRVGRIFPPRERSQTQVIPSSSFQRSPSRSPVLAAASAVASSSPRNHPHNTPSSSASNASSASSSASSSTSPSCASSTTGTTASSSSSSPSLGSTGSSSNHRGVGIVLSDDDHAMAGVGLDYLQHSVNGMLDSVVVSGMGGMGGLPDEDSLFSAYLQHPMDGVTSSGSGGSSGKVTGSVVL